MLKELLKATQDEEWKLASNLLYEQWAKKCCSAFTLKDDQPWESNFDEEKLCKKMSNYNFKI